MKTRIVLAFILPAGFLPAITGCLSGVSPPKNTPTPTPGPSSTPTHGPSPGESSDAAFNVNRRLGRGVNLGNALEAEYYEGYWGVVLEEEYFELIADKGFNSVRIPIRWSAHAQNEEPYTIEREFMERVAWAVDNALKNNLCAIINFHHYEEIFSDPGGQRDRFLALWEQVAEHFKEYPDSLVFEILNEPHGELTTVLWNELLDKALAVIRSTNPERIVLIGTAEWGGAGALSMLALPDDERLILTVHFYSPFQFTHQEAEWVEGADQWQGTPWEGSYYEKRALMDELAPVYWYAQKNKIPVNIGEFGAYSKADEESRALWTEFCARMFEDCDFSWHYWEFCSGFGIYDPDGRVFHDYLVNVLISDDTAILELGEPAGATGEELLANGDFSAGFGDWYCWRDAEYGAEWKVEDGVFRVDVQTAGLDAWRVQLIQDGISLEEGCEYLLAFEAWSDGPRSFSAGVGARKWVEEKNDYDYPSYGSASVFVTTGRQDYYVPAGVTETLATGRVVFSFGAETGAVYLDNVSLKKLP